MAGMFEDLRNVRGISQFLVGTSDENIATAIKVGLIHLTEIFHLNNVLYVLEFNCNLVSESQLIDHYNCLV